MRKQLLAILLLSVFCTGCAAGTKEAALYNDQSKSEVYDIDLETAPDTSAECIDGGAGNTATKSVAASAYLEEKPLIYVSFSQISDTLIGDDQTKLFISQCFVPSFATEIEKLNDWFEDSVMNAKLQTLEEMDQIREQAKTDHKRWVEEDLFDFYTYSYYSNVNIQRLDSNVISVLQVNSTYSGGVHPNYAQISYNGNLEDRSLLSLDDVIEPGSAEQLLMRLLDQLEGRFGDMETLGLYPDYQEIIKSNYFGTALTPNWYFTSQDLTIYFNCYDIAPYAAGIIKVSFPYDTLSGILKPEYFPEPTASGKGSATLLSDPEQRIVLEIPSEGTTNYIGTDHTIYDVKIYQLSSWVTDEMPIVGQLLFAANRLSSGEAIQISQSETSEHPEYLLSWHNGDRQLQLQVIDGQELRRITTVIAE